MPKKNTSIIAPPAPQVAQPSGRQRAQAEQHERADAVGHQVFPAREAEVGGDGADRGGEDQQEHVVDRMGDVEQEATGGTSWPNDRTRPPRSAARRRCDFLRELFQLWPAPAGTSTPSAAALRGERVASRAGQPDAFVLSIAPTSVSIRSRYTCVAGERIRIDARGTPGRCAAGCPRRRRTCRPRSPSPRRSARMTSSSTTSASIAPLVPPIGSIEPSSAAFASVVGCPSLSSAQPSGIGLPSFAATITLPRAASDSERSIDSGAPSRARKHRGDRDWCRTSAACRRRRASPPASCRTRARPCRAAATGSR